MNKVYSPKQRRLLRLWQQNKLKRLNILEGSVRSGKTWVSLVLWAFWVASSPKDKIYMMVGKTITTLKRNCLYPLQELVGEKNFTFSTSAKEASLFGRKVLLEGASDKRSEGKIRGVTLMGAYCDELTLFDEEFFIMLLSRASDPGAKIIATTNPDSPHHWLCKKYLSRNDLDLLSVKFLLDDNIFLDRDYIENLKKEYTGVFYNRFILGIWVVAEGAIYKEFSEHKDEFYIQNPKLPRLKYINIGVDFGGNKSNHAITATAFNDSMEEIFVLKAKSTPAVGVTVDEVVQGIISFADKIKQDYGFVDGIYCDSAEQAIINQLKSKSPYPVLNSIKNPIIDRIRCENMLISSRRLHIIKAECADLIDGLETAVWDDKQLKDTRLDNGTSDIDILDSFEYSFEPFIIYLTRGG